jgi:predicted metal-dependent hydrolase
MWRWKVKRVRRKRASSVTKHYVENKEAARELVLDRLSYFNQHYNLQWNRVAIRNQRRCWGSCSSLKNLNFNYKILLLPPHLSDYIIVHEMCHLKELNHGAGFWSLVAEVVPNYKKCVAELKAIDKSGHSVSSLLKVQVNYLSCDAKQAGPLFNVNVLSKQW